MAVAKSAEAFRTISEAASELDVPQHVLRHWEEVFGQIRPMRRAGGRRYYRPVDIDLLRGVRVLLYDERYTTQGVQKIFKENGVKYVAELGRLSAAGETIDFRPLLNEEATDREAKQQTAGAEVLTAEIHAKLSALLEKLESARDALDDAALALEGIDPENSDQEA